MMTKNFKPLALLLLAIIGLTVISCESGTEAKTPSIVGTWISEQIEVIGKKNEVIFTSEVTRTQDFIIRFDADGTGNFVSQNESFTYSSNKLTFDDFDFIDEHEIMTVSGIGEDAMTLRYEDTIIDGEDVFLNVRIFSFRRQK